MIIDATVVISISASIISGAFRSMYIANRDRLSPPTRTTSAKSARAKLTISNGSSAGFNNAESKEVLGDAHIGPSVQDTAPVSEDEGVGPAPAPKAKVKGKVKGRTRSKVFVKFACGTQVVIPAQMSVTGAEIIEPAMLLKTLHGEVDTTPPALDPSRLTSPGPPAHQP